MEANKETRKLKVSRFDGEQNNFYLKPQTEAAEDQVVSCKLKLQGIVDGEVKSVNTAVPLDNYKLYRFVNPYLNAQNDMFKISFDDITIGYIIPFAAIESADQNEGEEFDEIEQAYKFYCVKLMLEQFDFPILPLNEPVQLSKLVNPNSIFIIIYKPQVDDENFLLENCFPSLALRGYYHFPENSKPTVLYLSDDIAKDGHLQKLIEARFLFIREQSSISIRSSKSVLHENSILKLLYSRLLVESGNAVHRFLLLYQVIELLVDQQIRNDLEEVLVQKDALSNFKFIQKINELNNTRRAINKIFEIVAFDEKEEITNALRDFVLEFDSFNTSQATGECLYDIRNLLFHDFKTVIDKNRDGAVTSLTIQCEILIHQLLISFNKNKIGEEAVVVPEIVVPDVEIPVPEIPAPLLEVPVSNTVEDIQPQLSNKEEAKEEENAENKQ